MINLERSANDFGAQLAIIGPTQVGGLLSAALFGCLACQCYLYFARFTSDGFALKTIVSAITLIQLGQFVCIMLTLWTMTVSTYGDPSQLNVLPLAADVALFFSSFTVFIVQSFYAFRLWKLTRSIFLPILCEMISVVAHTSMVILSARAISMTDLTTFINSQIVLIALSWIARAVCDLITTVGVAWSLKKKRVSDFNMGTMIDRLIYWTLETALVTSVISITMTLSFVFQKQNFVWFGVLLLWSNVVGNSLLASLNRRLLLQETRRSSRSDTQPLSSSGLDTICFRAGPRQSYEDSLENFENRDVEVLREPGRSIDMEPKRVSKHAVVHIHGPEFQDHETHC
ncbi:hypothetical protein BD769DRAFT_1774748 [Suillus cothurnatus]|nr:hypothetical protein BD769DRAFT_1774748 [Suillus cothurnatus]